MFKKKLITTMLAFGLITSSVFVSNADIKEQDTKNNEILEFQNSRTSQNGWQSQNGHWYYYKNGAKQIGWIQDAGRWYLLNSSGQMLTGWQQVSGKWYYLEGNGSMETGWKKLSNKWYYLNTGGTMATGWNQISNKWYYMYASGAMAANTTIDGWKIDASGIGRKIENVTSEYKSALQKAKQYSDIMSMSKRKIYDQLTSPHGEKFSKEAAQYAIDNVNANWKENALKKAQTYQETMSMSPSRIYDQLVSEYGEKFTPEEAQYAIDNLK
ncbi:MAG: Ltp family lipoprotein [Romboutsia sp.]